MMRHMVTAPSQPKQVPRASEQASYVQFGCGWSAPREWTNFDSSATLKWERIPILGRYTKNERHFPSNVKSGNIVKGFPVADNSCQGVYASHVLEHLAYEEFHTALQNTYRILDEGGIFRLVVPDLEWAAREYISRLDRGDPKANAFFLSETTLGVRGRERGLIGLARKLFNT